MFKGQTFYTQPLPLCSRVCTCNYLYMQKVLMHTLCITVVCACQVYHSLLIAHAKLCAWCQRGQIEQIWPLMPNVLHMLLVEVAALFSFFRSRFCNCTLWLFLMINVMYVMLFPIENQTKPKHSSTVWRRILTNSIVRVSYSWNKVYFIEPSPVPITSMKD